ncbi:MAG: hypothetical protein JO202_01720 [Ktedonobacteraceae bacterium]|nr:hypothetical protein [Ktedonobacteraceae bacterium]
MATVLLTEEEYNHIQGLMNDLLSKVQQASPRAATHYATIAKMHAYFIANEDGKRAASKVKASTRETIQKAKEARRGTPPPQSTTRTGRSSATPSA